MRINFFQKLSIQLLRDFIDQCHEDKDYGIDFELACEVLNSRIDPIIIAKV